MKEHPVARFRNSSGEQRAIPEATPQVVDPDGLFDVPDDRADAFSAQPWFTRVADNRKKDEG